jgi:predicted transcriptional regulator
MKQVRPEDDLWGAIEEMDRDGVNQLPVMMESKVVGMLRREDIINYLRTLREFRT